VGVDDREGGFFFKQVVERGNQHRVLEHVGVVAGMEGVAVTEHEGFRVGGRCTTAYQQRLR
jgi:hypothetical protein